MIDLLPTLRPAGCGYHTLLWGILVAWGCGATWGAEPYAAADSQGAIRMTNPRTERWQLGVVVRARGPITGIVATMPVPMPWPEQDVEIVDSQASRHVRSVRYRVLEDGVKQMTVSIPRLTAGDQATALVTMEIVKRDIVTPQDTSQLRVPRDLPRDMKKYLEPSPYIESEDPLIIESAQKAIAGKESGWEQTEAIFDWVRDRIEYRFDRHIKSARRALDDGYGDCEELTSLFVAMCRVAKDSGPRRLGTRSLLSGVLLGRPTGRWPLVSLPGRRHAGFWRHARSATHSAERGPLSRPWCFGTTALRAGDPGCQKRYGCTRGGICPQKAGYGRVRE